MIRRRRRTPPCTATTSSHDDNGVIWESDITRGLLSWEIRGDAMGGTMNLKRLNPQTQEFTTG